jgi:antitoxin component HigA of HigAB toxin-antitoxin module
VAAPQPAISASDIQSFVNANIGNPATIANAMQQYNVSANDIASAMGVDPSVVNSYLSNTGS